MAKVRQKHHLDRSESRLRILAVDELGDHDEVH